MQADALPPQFESKNPVPMIVLSIVLHVLVLLLISHNVNIPSTHRDAEPQVIQAHIVLPPVRQQAQVPPPPTVTPEPKAEAPVALVPEQPNTSDISELPTPTAAKAAETQPAEATVPEDNIVATEEAPASNEDPVAPIPQTEPKVSEVPKEAPVEQATVPTLDVPASDLMPLTSDTNTDVSINEDLFKAGAASQLKGYFEQKQQEEAAAAAREFNYQQSSPAIPHFSGHDFTTDEEKLMQSNQITTDCSSMVNNISRIAMGLTGGNVTCADHGDPEKFIQRRLNKQDVLTEKSDPSLRLPSAAKKPGY